MYMVTFDVEVVFSRGLLRKDNLNYDKQMGTCYNWLLTILLNGVGSLNEKDEDCLAKAVLRKLQNTMMIICQALPL